MTRRVITVCVASAFLAAGAAATPALGAGCDDPFGCGPSQKPMPSHAQKLSIKQAKTEARRRMLIEASGWDYQGYVMVQPPSCAHRISATRIDCPFGIYQRLDYSNGGPADPKSCNYVAHVWLPKHSSHPKSTLEMLGCRHG